MSYLPPTRELRERLDTAQTLTRFFYRERAVALACGAWIPRVPRLESKAELGRTGREPNARVVTDYDTERFFELMISVLS